MGFNRKNVVVTGGLGFIGSNLVLRLVREGARVTVIDSLIPGCGGNRFHLEAVRNEVAFIEASIDSAAAAPAVEEAGVVFNLAGEISHIHSMVLAERDLEINTLAQLRFLQVCSERAPGIRIVYAGTRQVYGVPEYLPVDEKHPVNPVDFNGVHKYAATMYHLMLTRTGALDAVVLRLTNVYGPRMALDVPCQGFLSAYLRLTLAGRRLEIFGDGRQLRDPVFVDDVVDAMLAAGLRTDGSRSYNIGGPEALTVAEIARLVSRAGGTAEPVQREFPEDRKAIDIGSYYTDSTLAKSELRWSPRVLFAEGVERTLAYYRENLPHYLDPANPNPQCKLVHPERPRGRARTAV